MDMSSVKKFFTPQRMRIIIIVAAVIVIWMTMDFVSYITPPLKMVSFPEAGFSMKFFNEPNPNEAKYEYKDKIIEGKSFMSRGGSLSLVLVYFELSEEIMAEDNFDDIIDFFVQQQIASLKSGYTVEKEELGYDNAIAKRVRLKIKNHTLTQDFYLHNNRLYNAIAAVRPNPFGSNQEALDEFLNSFRIIE